MSVSDGETELRRSERLKAAKEDKAGTSGEVQRQLEEMRHQLEAALSFANKEKAERVRLEEMLVEQNKFTTTTSAETSAETTYSYTSAQSSIFDPFATVVTTTTTATGGISYTSTQSSLLNPSTAIVTTTTATGGISTGSKNLNTASNQAMPYLHHVPTFLPPLPGTPHQGFTAQPPTILPPYPTGRFESVPTGFQVVRAKLYDLPEFTGRPEDWPLFSTAFRDSTAMYNYSDVDNLFRLQKCLKGQAREVVESMLIHPSNINQAMAALEFRFGRPDILLRSQILKVNEIQPIPEDKLELLVPFATKVQNLATFLEASMITAQLANPTILDELVSKLPMSKKLEWIERSLHCQPYPTIRQFEQWLTGAARLVCLAIPIAPHHASRTVSKSTSRNVLHAAEQRVSNTTHNQNCHLCRKSPHNLADCCMFRQLNTSAKWDFVKKQRLCFCCLKYGHSVRFCRARKTCGRYECEKKHHPLLHEENGEATVSTVRESPVVGKVLSCSRGKNNKILFKVLPVRLYGNGVIIRTYALLDEGSSVTIMSTKLAKDLNLSGCQTDLKLQWFGNESFTSKSFVVDLHISSDADDAEQFRMERVHTVNELSLPTQTLTTADLDAECVACLPAIEYDNARPQILIGLDHCHLGVPIRMIGSNKAGPVVAETRLGYVVYGKSNQTPKNNPLRILAAFDRGGSEEEDHQLTTLVENYFSLESFGVQKPKKELLSKDDKRALQILSETTKEIGNRYQTGLLWKEDNIELPPSFSLAHQRFSSLENKFRREPEFAKKYKSVLSSYVAKGYARPLNQNEAKLSNPKTWYLPHFGVSNPNKPGKIRLVFDAAAKVNGISLNSALLKGPDELKPLMTILYNFRTGPIAVTGDIKEMFHQVVIQPSDQNSQRFLWRESEDQPLEVFVMQSMTFGASCSPCSANYVKNLHAKKFVSEFPRAVSAITNHYVDDYVESYDSVTEAIDVTNAVISIHRSGGFELRNFVSNSKEVLNNITMTEEEPPNQIVNMNIEAAIERVLGTFWDPEDDVYLFKLNFSRIPRDIMNGERCLTKRELLAITMSIFDPYGMIANFVIHAKLLLQSVWNRSIEWDQQIPDDIFRKWCSWRAELPNVMQLKVPRCYHPSLYAATRVVLHTFVDASEEAFSSVVYMRIEYMEEVSVAFVCGKTRCAPKKLTSIPRLELSAAVLGIRLCESIIECHSLKPACRVFWSDSKTVLSWLHSDPRRHKQFVGFRIAEILESTQPSEWRWIPTKLNPADEATRSRYPPAFSSDNKWIKGPSFLKFPELQWPAQPDDYSNHICRDEIKSKFLLHASVSTPMFEFDRFSRYLKLKRAAAWVLRFVNACRRQPIELGELSATELNSAELLLCREAQRDVFMEEICQISSGQPVDRSSSIFKLTPYLEDDGLLRVYGRINAASSIPFTSRRPIILPKNHALTNLIVAHFHRRLCHQNDDTVANEIRQTFWVPSLRSAIKKERSRCSFCIIRSSRPLPPLMGQLPADRVTPFVRPFSYTGLDYFGPVNVTIARHKEKRWVALFTCLTVRAVHLELAADLSTDACILCIRNFVNRRGVPMCIRSDNGTNFIGAKNELLTAANVFDIDAIKKELSARGIKWIFNCPSNPHAGGCWERLVRSVKRVLSVTLNELAPRSETLVSALIEAENIVNSRPLTHLPVTSEEAEPLTPNHFLIGGTNSTQTPGPIDERALCLRKQWKISQQIKDRFWRRWIREYLPELTMRSKWFARTPNIEVGNLVLICDGNAPRSQWARGRVIKVFIGPDGQVRSADVKTTTGILRRPAVNLAVLKLVGEASESPGASRGAGC